MESVCIVQDLFGNVLISVFSVGGLVKQVLIERDDG